MTPPDHATANRQRLLATVQPAVERPRRSPNDVRISVAVLVIGAILAATSLAIVAARLADDVRDTHRLVVEAPPCRT